MLDFTIAVFGECGQGKSTLLTKISDVYRQKYDKSEDEPIEFEASASLTSVTSKVRQVTSGNMTLVDSPGLNDPNKTRTDKLIFLELVNTIRETLQSKDKGINMFIQCIMPDKSDRIRKSVIQTMMNFLLILSVFHRDTSIQELELCHPKIAIVFNNVSKKECGYLKVLERIDAYKQLLLEEAIEFYCEKISDDTYIGNKKWKGIKKAVMES